MRTKRNYTTPPQQLQGETYNGSTVLTKIQSNAYDLNGMYLAPNDAAATTRANLTPVISRNHYPSTHPDHQLLLQKPDVMFDLNNIKSNEIPNTLYTGSYGNPNAPDQNTTKAWRTQSKHRSIGAWSLIHANSFGEQAKQPVAAYILTGCGINLMGTSPQENHRFLDKPNLPRPRQGEDGKAKFKNQAAKNDFKATYKQLYLRWLWQMNHAGVEVAIVPMVGGDLYTQMLDPANRQEAQRMIHEAFKEAAEEFNTLAPKNSPSRHLNEIIYVLPDSNGQLSNAHQTARNVFQGYPNGNTNSPTVTITNGDMLDLTIKLKTPHSLLKVGILNAGSDRTIGGGYKEWQPGGDKVKGAPPVEETLATNTDFVYRQALDFRLNKSLQDFEVTPYPQGLRLATATSSAARRQRLLDMEENDEALAPDGARIQPINQRQPVNPEQAARELADSNTHFESWAQDKGLRHETRHDLGHTVQVVTLDVHHETVNGRQVEKSRCELTKNGSHDLSLTGVREENRDEMAEQLVEAFLATYYGENDLPDPLPAHTTMVVTTESDELFAAIQRAADEKGLTVHRHGTPRQSVEEYRAARERRLQEARDRDGGNEPAPAEEENIDNEDPNLRL